MNDRLAKKVDCTFQEAYTKTIAALKDGGFGIIAEIDLKEEFRERLGIDFRNYKLLVACNPRLALPAIEQFDQVGTLLPCHVLIQEHVNWEVEVAAVNLMEGFSGIDNPHLQAIVREISGKLKSVFDTL